MSHSVFLHKKEMGKKKKKKGDGCPWIEGEKLWVLPLLKRLTKIIHIKNLVPWLILYSYYVIFIIIKSQDQLAKAILSY